MHLFLLLALQFLKGLHSCHEAACLLRVVLVLLIALLQDGEEFLVVLPDCDEFSATAKAETLREIIEDLSPSGLPVTASFGVAQLRTDDSYDSIFNRADMAMYEAKRAGRNCVVNAE